MVQIGMSPKACQVTVAMAQQQVVTVVALKPMVARVAEAAAVRLLELTATEVTVAQAVTEK
jgi:hypothetical protein